MLNPTRLRAFLYAAPIFLTPFVDKIGGILEKDEWPSLPRLVLSGLIGSIAAFICLRAFYDGSAERSKTAAPSLAPPVVAAALIAACVLFSGCATRFIDKVSQTRAATVSVSYRAASEFNAWLQPRTNNPAAFRTTYDALMSKWSNVNSSVIIVGNSAEILEAAEEAYRVAPTNGAFLISTLGALTAQSSNIQAIIQETK